MVMIDGIDHPMVPDRPYWYAEMYLYESMVGSVYPAWRPRLVTTGVMSPRLDGVVFPTRGECEAYIQDFLGAQLKTPDDETPPAA